MRKRQRELDADNTRTKKRKIEVQQIFQDKQFVLNEADPELMGLLENYGAEVFLFSYYGGGFNVWNENVFIFNY